MTVIWFGRGAQSTAPARRSLSAKAVRDESSERSTNGTRRRSAECPDIEPDSVFEVVQRRQS